MLRVGPPLGCSFQLLQDMVKADIRAQITDKSSYQPPVEMTQKNQDLEVQIWLERISIGRQGVELQGAVAGVEPGWDDHFKVNPPQLSKDTEIFSQL